MFVPRGLVALTLLVLAAACTGSEEPVVVVSIQGNSPTIPTSALPEPVDVVAIEAPNEAEDVGGWQALSASPLGIRCCNSVVWTGDEVIVWGGMDDAGGADPSAVTGAAFDPEAGTWRVLAAAPVHAVRQGHSAVWTGSEMVVWGGSFFRMGMHNGAYDPVYDEWRVIVEAPIRHRVWGQSAIWTGKEVIIWGAAPPQDALGAAYDPAGDSWRVVAEAPIDNRFWSSAVWTGSELIIWGGSEFTSDGNGTYYQDGAAYDPEADSWHSIAPGPLAGRWQHSAVWTGSEMLVWGGAGSGGDLGTLDDGAAYDPVTDEWRMLVPSPLGSRRMHTAVWTERGMLIWGGSESTGWGAWTDFNQLSSGAVFDPAANTWSEIPPSVFSGSTTALRVVWTGSELVYWGQGDDSAKAGGELFRFPTEAGQAIPGRSTWDPPEGGYWDGTSRMSPSLELTMRFTTHVALVRVEEMGDLHWNSIDNEWWISDPHIAKPGTPSPRLGRDVQVTLLMDIESPKDAFSAGDRVSIYVAGGDTVVELSDEDVKLRADEYSDQTSDHDHGEEVGEVDPEAFRFQRYSRVPTMAVTEGRVYLLFLVEGSKLMKDRTLMPVLKPSDGHEMSAWQWDSTDGSFFNEATEERIDGIAFLDELVLAAEANSVVLDLSELRSELGLR